MYPNTIERSRRAYEALHPIASILIQLRTGRRADMSTQFAIGPYLSGLMNLNELLAHACRPDRRGMKLAAQPRAWKISGTVNGYLAFADPGPEVASQSYCFGCAGGLTGRKPGSSADDLLTARGETPARRRAVDFTRDRGPEARTPLVPARCAELRQRRARVKDTSEARDSFATGC